MSTPTTPNTELLEKLEYMRNCPCYSCPQGHSQAKTGCPLCDGWHGEAYLLTNTEVLQLITQAERRAELKGRIAEIESCLRVYRDSDASGMQVRADLGDRLSELRTLQENQANE